MQTSPLVIEELFSKVVMCGREDVCSLILDKGLIDLNKNIKQDEHPLVLAAINGRVNMVKMLLNSCQENTTRPYVQIALHGAMSNNRTEVYETLKCVPHVGSLVLAVTENDEVACESVLCCDRNAHTYYPELSAFKEISIYNFHFKPEYTPLQYAVENKNEEICRILLQNGADPNFINIGDHPLYVAITHKQIGIVRLLLEYKANTSIMNKYEDPIYRKNIN